MSDNFFKTRNGITVGSLSGAPANPVNGDVYYDSTLGEFQAYQNGAWGPLGGGSGGGGGGINLLKSSDNPDFETGTTGWTASGGTFTSISSGQIYGTKSGQWTASASSQTLYSSLKALSSQPGLEGNNCMAAISYSYPSGTSGDYSLVVSDGTNILANQSLNVTTTPQDAVVTFVCPSSGSLKVGLLSNVASPNAITLDGASFNGGQVLLGSNVLVNQLSQAQLVASVYYPTTTSCNWGVTGSSFAAFGTNANCPGPTVEASTGVGTVDTTNTHLPQVTVNGLPAGRYVVVASLISNGFSSANTCYTINDGSTSSGQACNAIAGNVPTIVTGWFNYTTAGNRTFAMWGNHGTGGTNTILNDSTGERLYFQIYKWPNSTETVYSASQTPSSWSGYSTVSSGWSTTSTTYADVSAGTGIALTQLSSRNMTCSAHATLPAITCFLPKAGMWEIKASTELLTATAANQPSARLVDGNNNIIDPGRTSFDAAGGNHIPLPLEGVYVATAPGNVTFKVQVANNNSFTTSVSNGLPAGSAAIQWIVKDVDAINSAPVLVGQIPVAFHATTTSITVTTTQVAKWTTIDFDTHNAYNATTGEWAAPYTGYYNVAAYFANSTNPSRIGVFKNGVQFAILDTVNSDGILQGNTLVSLTAGDKITLKMTLGTTGTDATDNISISQVH